MNIDAINGFFEAGLAIMLWLNLRRLIKDKRVAGFDWRVTGFTTLWGVWNLYYYPALEQMISFYADIGVVTANALWLALVAYYHSRQGVANADNHQKD